MSNNAYKWVFNTSVAKEDSLDLSKAGCRSRMGDHIDGDAGQKGIYVHKDDLDKTANYYESKGMQAEAQFVREAIQSN